MTAALGNARLLTMRGDGHTAFGGNSECINRRVVRYVMALELPREGSKCKQRVPFPPEPRPAIAASAGARTALVPAGVRRARRGG